MDVKKQINMFMNQISVSELDKITAFGFFDVNLNIGTSIIFYVLDSERSEECIDFTMMCVFFCFFVFVSVYSITSQNNAPISNNGGGFRCKSEYPWCIIEDKIFKKIEKNKKKLRKNGNFYAKPVFALFAYVITRVARVTAS
ncbi:Uncharacterized protein FWK35_00030858 [Aphis craccivora]|uniref:Transmembrane protein n=1 Tax=Aphis craccivora TaxID=307492 RepID=A0A6G0Y3B9_APHCR|nr:Uncharacterized protein FWK35_00030858 [Aphis craccivora]